MNLSFACGWVHAALLAAGCTVAAGASAQFQLPASGCPMAHCAPSQSDQVHLPIPRSAERVAVDTVPVGGGGLGCVSNGTIAACSFRGDPARQSNLVVYDADGRRLWEDGGVLGWQAWFSAPLVGTDGSVVAADNRWVLRVQPATGTVLWRSAKPDPGTPISPVPVGTDTPMLLVATKDNIAGGEPAVTVWDLETGALLSQLVLRDPATGAVYITRNTVATNGRRAYVVGSRMDDENAGRLFAIDVCEGRRCGGRGALQVRWTYDFNGPSGVSPLLLGDTLIFDGRPVGGIGSLMAVRDTGKRPRRLWFREFVSTFGVSPAQDRRGGFWVHYVAPDGKTLMRLSEADGSLLQEIDVSAVLGVEPGYVAHSVTMMATTDAGAEVVIIGAQPEGNSTRPTYVAAIDVSSDPAGRLLWRHQVGANKDENAAGGQFPILVNAQGARRILFQGSKAGALLVGEP
jgi:hypothetical protein